MTYDVIVIGAGIIGALITHALTPYHMRVLVIEKNNEVGDETTKANSAIIHAGYDPEPGTLKARLNVLGNALYGTLCDELGVAFQRCGSYVLATTDEECDTLRALVNRAHQNGVSVELMTGDQIREKEPHVSTQVMLGLYAPSAGILAPWDVVYATLNNAVAYGNEVHLSEPVTSIEHNGNHYLVHTSQATYHAGIVINAAGHGALGINQMIGARVDFDIQPTRGQYYVIDRGFDEFAHAVLFPTPSSLGKGVLVVPTIHGNYLLGPTSEKVLSDQDKGVTKEGLLYIKKQLERIVDRVPYQGIIRSFSGIRPKLSTHDFVIEEDTSHPGFIYLIGIDSPGLASAPAIGRYVAEMVLKIRPFEQRPHYFAKPYKSLDLAHQSPEMINRYIHQDSTYGHIVCRCEQISEGEIRDAIRGPLGARSIDGVKRRARPGAGRCQGGFCQPIVLALLAEELRLPKNEIPLDRIGSEILLAETKTTEGESHE